MKKNYNYYSAYLKKRYQGKRVYKIIVDAGFSCPNRDGTKGYGGCSYCNTESFTPISRNLETMKDQILHGMKRAKQYYKAEQFIVYFQPNTNTYASVDVLQELYDEAVSVESASVVGLSVGTRPDCVDSEKIELLESYTERGLQVDLEMGMESMYDTNLEQINRGCSHDEFLHAMELLKDRNLDVCIHSIFGLPGETRDMMLAYADELNRLPKINFLKLHHLHVVKGSIMGVHYLRNPFPLFSLETYADFLCDFLPLLRPDIVLQRIFGLSDPDMLIAPNWGLKKSEIQYYLDQQLEKKGVIQGSAYKAV